MDGNEKSQWGRAEFGSLLEKWPKVRTENRRSRCVCAPV